MTPGEKHTRELLTAIADTIKETLPKGHTFCLVTFWEDAEREGENRANYIGTITRESAIKALREILGRWEKNEWMTHEE